VNEVYFIHLPMKMEPIVSSETSAIRTQTPGNYPKRNNLRLEICLRLNILKYKAEKHRRLQTLKIQRSANRHKLMYIMDERKTRTPITPLGPMIGDSRALRQGVSSEQKFLTTFCRRRLFTQTNCARQTTHCQILIKMHMYHEQHPFEAACVSGNTWKITRVCVSLNLPTAETTTMQRA